MPATRVAIKPRCRADGKETAWEGDGILSERGIVSTQLCGIGGGAVIWRCLSYKSQLDAT